MYITKLKSFLSTLLITSILFSFYPSTAKADVASCSIDSFYVVSGLSVEATWSMYSTTGGTYYDAYISWDGGPRSIVSKQTGDPSFADSGIVGTTFSSYGNHWVTIDVGGVHCVATAYIDIPEPVQLGTICSDANVGTQIVISGPGGTFVGNPSVCADTVVGTYNVTGASVANYNGPSYSNGHTLTIPAWGAVSTFLTYSPYLYRCSGGGSCIRDDVSGNTTSSNCNNSCVAPVDGTCGSANGKTYASGVTAYSPDTQCSNGSASNTSFPSAGGSVSWTCSGSNGGSSSATCSASRSAAASAPVVTISASPTSVTSGGSSTLTWSSTNSPTSCTASNGWSGAKAASGSQSTGSLSSNTTYTLSCANASGSGSSSATVTVSGASSPDLTASVFSFPTTGTAGSAQNYIATISNVGSASTGIGFSNFFQVNSGSNGSGTSYDRTPISVSAVASGGSVNIVDSIAFSSAGNKSVRVCADKTSSAGGGVITESNETDASNCTGWTNVTVSAAPSGYSVTVTPTTGGTVKSADNILNCGSTCSSPYSQNSTVTLQAYPASSYWKFNGWSGDCSGLGLCVLVVNGAKVVTPSFVLRSFNYSEF